MRILLIEDDEDKRRQIMEALSEISPAISLGEARSLQSGLKAILAGNQDFVILDMTMPTFDIGGHEDGGRPQAYAGRELLWHMKRRGIRVPAVVVTQFDRFGEGREASTLEELDCELRAAHSGQYLGAIRYNVTYQTWKEELQRIIRHQLREMEESDDKNADS